MFRFDADPSSSDPDLSLGIGQDTIADFSAAEGDVIHLAVINVPGAHNFVDLVQNHLRDNGGTAELFFGNNSILLEGYTVADFSETGPIGRESFDYPYQSIYGDEGPDSFAGSDASDWV